MIVVRNQGIVADVCYHIHITELELYAPLHKSMVWRMTQV